MKQFKVGMILFLICLLGLLSIQACGTGIQTVDPTASLPPGAVLIYYTDNKPYWPIRLIRIEDCYISEEWSSGWGWTIRNKDNISAIDCSSKDVVK